MTGTDLDLPHPTSPPTKRAVLLYPHSPGFSPSPVDWWAGVGGVETVWPAKEFFIAPLDYVCLTTLIYHKTRLQPTVFAVVAQVVVVVALLPLIRGH